VGYTPCQKGAQPVATELGVQPLAGLGQERVGQGRTVGPLGVQQPGGQHGHVQERPPPREAPSRGPKHEAQGCREQRRVGAYPGGQGRDGQGGEFLAAHGQKGGPDLEGYHQVGLHPQYLKRQGERGHEACGDEPLGGRIAAVPDCPQ